MHCRINVASKTVVCRHFVGLTSASPCRIFAPSNRETMLNEKTNKTEKYQARSKMLEKLIDQIYEQQENEINENNKVITSKH